MSQPSGGSGGAGGAKWPGPVTFNDDDPKQGFSTIFLTVPELSVTKGLLGFGKAMAKNAEIRPEFTKTAVNVTIKVQAAGGESIHYEYKKPLPEDIDPSKCTHKFKNDKVVLHLCKASKLSWQQHSKYLIKRE